MSMKSFEPIYKELEYLLIQKLPECIDKTNKEHNDGIILKSFENKSLEENCIKTPSFIFNIEETEYSEKDRIVENTIYTVSIELKLQPNIELRPIIFSRYSEAIALIIQKDDMWIDCKITNSKGNKIVMRITV